jgi:tRNA-dihydrouridine synthase A
MIPYLERLEAREGRAWPALRHMLGLFHGAPGARLWRRRLSERGGQARASAVADALDEMARLRTSEAA